MPKLQASKLSLVFGLSTIALLSAMPLSASAKDANNSLAGDAVTSNTQALVPAASVGQAAKSIVAIPATAATPTPAAGDGKAAASKQAPNSPVDQAAPDAGTVVHVHAGQELTVGTDSDGLVTTEDVELAKKQVASYPDNPEAHFILAVALTRTSYVEEALQEVRRARRLAQNQGGAQYFDKMIAADEKLLTYSPKENRVRYSLAWAYYMKAYLLAQESRKDMPPQKATNQTQIAVPDAALQLAASLGIKAPKTIAPIQGAMDKADASAQPQVKKYYELALTKLDELLKQEPADMWARVYRAHLKAEYTGNLEEAMATWHQCQKDAPDNPAPYFFLGEGYLKQGNLKESLGNISRAIALRAQGK